MPELSSLHDVLFPTAIAFGATGGPERRTEIVTLVSGREKRNARSAFSRRRYDVGTGLRSLADLCAILAFFEARRGALHAFRFRDPLDMKSCAAEAEPAATDQLLGTGDGSRARFALVKRYGEGPDAYERPIRLPVAGTLAVTVAGTPSATPAAWSFDMAAGDIVFQPGAIPASGQAVTAGFVYDVAVRFDTERLEVSIAGFKAGQIPTIPLVEVLS